MQNKSISFNAEMLKAILDGRKTQTRRIINCNPCDVKRSMFSRSGLQNKHGYELLPKYRVSDILTVKEDKHISLKITSVRAEKLQDITEQDAVAEGFCLTPKDIAKEDKTPSITWFRGLWDSIYGNDESKQWEANLWVWVYEFERV